MNGHYCGTNCTDDKVEALLRADELKKDGFKVEVEDSVTWEYIVPRVPRAWE
jgi:hypothetical protein